MTSCIVCSDTEHTQVDLESSFADLMCALDEFQTIGIPCWESFAGPLDNPNERDRCDFHENGGMGRCGYCEES